MLNVALAATVFCHTLLQGMAGSQIAGASSQRRYFTLGVQMTHGVKYVLSGQIAQRLQHLLPRSFAIATEFVIPSPYTSLALPDRSRHLLANVAHVSAHYFQAVDVPQVIGHVISVSDVDTGASVVVLNRMCAVDLFGSAHAALGRMLLMEMQGSRSTQAWRVIGVVPDTFMGIRASSSYFYRSEPMAWVPNLPMMFEPALLSVPANVSRAVIRHDLNLAWRHIPELVRGVGSQGVVTSQPLALDPRDVNASIRQLRLYRDLALAAMGLTVVNLVAIGLLDGLRYRSVRAIERTLGASHGWQLRRDLYRVMAGGVFVLFTTGILLISAFSILHRIIVNIHGQGAPWLRVGASLGWSHWLGVALLAILFVVALDMVVHWFILFVERYSFDGDLFHNPSTLRRAGAAILVIEFGMALLFVALAGWSLEYSWNAAHQNLGMLQGKQVTIVTMGIKRKFYPSPPNAVLVEDLREAINAVFPGTHVAFGPVIGVPYHHGAGDFRDEGPGSLSAGGAHSLDAQSFAATTNWLQVANVRLLAGRGFVPGHFNPNDILIDDVVARTLFGNSRAAVGQQIHFHPFASINPRNFYVRGVFSPLYLDGPTRAPVVSIVRALQPDGMFFMDGYVGDMLIRPAVPRVRYRALQGAIQRVFAKDARSYKVSGIQSSTQFLDRLDRPQRILATAFGAVAGFGLLIALTGLVVLLRLFLAMRKRVDAIRQALGASPRRQYAGVVVGTLMLVLAGALLALLFTPWLAQQFALLSGAQVAPFGWPTWLALAVLLLAVFAVAHFPAHRAARVEPAESLHEL